MIARPLILGLRQVMHLTGLTAADIWYLLALGEFPQPCGADIWLQEDVWLWITELIHREVVKAWN